MKMPEKLALELFFKESKSRVFHIIAQKPIIY